MDIVSHAVAGAAVGHAFGQPLLGAAFGILPDIVLGIRRRAAPTAAYNLTHSLPFTAGAGALCALLWATPVPALALLSHLLLDVPTHGKQWAPTLFYPFSSERFGFGEEWEFFSPCWWMGLLITFVWSVAWILA